MGLGSYWGEVIDVLRDIIPVYDKVNSFISLGKDTEHRTKAIKGRIKKGDKVLDAGSGFGNMSKTAAKIVDDDLSIILYDPLVPMLKNTDRLFDKKLDRIVSEKRKSIKKPIRTLTMRQLPQYEEIRSYQYP